MSYDPAARDQPWARTLWARAARELVLCGVFGGIVRTYARREVAGLEHVRPLGRPAIFVANHCSHVDTPVLLLSLPAGWRRRTAVAAAADYFYARRLLAGAVSLAFGTVPIERRGSGAGTEASHLGRLLEAGWNLVIFAEGTRSRDGRVGRMRSGAAVLAAAHGVPVVPVHISGTHQAMPLGHRWMVRPAGAGRRGRHTICVSFGPSIDVSPGERPSQAMAEVRRFMKRCGAEMAKASPDPVTPRSARDQALR